jgi:hypothetical protein
LYRLPASAVTEIAVAAAAEAAAAAAVTKIAVAANAEATAVAAVTVMPSPPLPKLTAVAVRPPASGTGQVRYITRPKSEATRVTT